MRTSREQSSPSVIWCRGDSAVPSNDAQCDYAAQRRMTNVLACSESRCCLDVFLIWCEEPDGAIEDELLRGHNR